MKISLKRRFITADHEKCVGCGICEYACSYEKEKTFNPLKSCIRVVRLDLVVNMALACRMCEDPPCVAACPRDALRSSKGTGVIIVDENSCTGCGWCIEACDYGAIMIHRDRKTAFACDLCGGRPVCIDWCPEGALELVTADSLAQKARTDIVERFCRTKIVVGGTT